VKIHESTTAILTASSCTESLKELIGVVTQSLVFSQLGYAEWMMVRNATDSASVQMRVP